MGMGISCEVLKNLVRKPCTKEYPYRKVKTYPKFRGKIIFDPQKCNGCGLCRVVCPTGAIKLGKKIKRMRIKNVVYKRVLHPIKAIDLGRCVRCGLCVDSCPRKAIMFTQEFELAERDREKLLVT